MQISEAVKLKIDLGAENTIAAQRDCEKIAVEIKSFITDSDINEFHAALGQYLNYVQALEDKEPERVVYTLTSINLVIRRANTIRPYRVLRVGANGIRPVRHHKSMT